MFAISSGVQQVLILAGATIIAAICIAAGRALMKLLQNRQTQARENDFDQRTLAEFFFDTDRDPRTGAPAKEGWTTKVDRTLRELTASQLRIEKAVHLTLGEVVKDGNGGHNLRGGVDRLNDRMDKDETT